jgi:hypothetical protein
MTQRNTDQHERSAAGLDFDQPIRERAASLGASMAEKGPEVVLDEIEELLPEAWRDYIRSFPIAALAVGVGVGIFLGMRKSDEVIAAGSSLISAAAMSNLNAAMEKVKGE